LFIPLAGLDRRVIVEQGSPLVDPVTDAEGNRVDTAKLDASLAHTVQIFLGVSF